MKELELAVDDCNDAIALNPDYIKVLVRKSQINEKLEKFDEAIKGIPLI